MVAVDKFGMLMSQLLLVRLHKCNNGGKLTKEGPTCGYFVNPDKTWLVTKEANLEAATSLFTGKGVNIT